MSSVLIVQQVLHGLLDGVYYLLIALGLSLIFSLGGIVNLAHGAFYAIGAYLTVVLAEHFGFGGALVLSPVAVALLGILIERFLFRPFYRRDPILSLLLTFGLAMVAEQALRMIFGAPPLSFAIPDDLRDYADAEQVINRALQSALRGQLAPGGRDPSPGDSSGGGTTIPGTGSGGPDDPNGSGTGGGEVAAPEVDTSAPSSVPIPLLVLGGMSIALLAAGGLGYLSRRRQAAHDELPPDDFAG